MQKNRSRDSERIWWMVLVEAEARSDIHSGSGSIHWMNVANHARVILRDKYNINLDTIRYKAEDLLDDLIQKEYDREMEFEKHSALVQSILDDLSKK